MTEHNNPTNATGVQKFTVADNCTGVIFTPDTMAQSGQNDTVKQVVETLAAKISQFKIDEYKQQLKQCNETIATLTAHYENDIADLAKDCDKETHQCELYRQQIEAFENTKSALNQTVINLRNQNAALESKLLRLEEAQESMKAVKALLDMLKANPAQIKALRKAVIEKAEESTGVLQKPMRQTRLNN